MDKEYFKSRLVRVFNENGLKNLINMDKVEKFLSLTEIMLEENEKYNLTAITETDKIILCHYADCAAISEYIKRGSTVIDVGTGAGFPALPLAIIRDDLTITAVDSTAKRVAYVENTAKLLGLTNVRTMVMRAEDGGKNPLYREKFDVAVARAVAEMRVLSELCLPFVKVGGSFIAMKGKNAEYELQGAKKALSVLGGRNAECKELTLHSDTEVYSHPLITVAKRERTPIAYPRAYAKISKSPL